MAGGVLPAGRAARTWIAVWTLAEAGVVTLFASLWFDSLGHGGWWLLFFLLGLLAASPVRLRRLGLHDQSRRSELVWAFADTARYVGAGAMLAWRLG